MSNQSSIEWTDATWNPVRGCVKISAGCKNCYAETFAQRWRGVPGHPYEQGFDLRLVPEKLDEPLRWKKPRRIFVNSMSDLFQEGVPDEFIDRVFAVMALCPQHTFQVLTKRADRMREYIAGLTHGAMREAAKQLKGYPGADPWDFYDGIRFKPIPLPNVWLGVSIENQQYADERIPMLLQTPAAKRFVSYEPALAAVNFIPWLGGDCRRSKIGDPCNHNHDALDQIIVGGESGPGVRPFNIQWARDVVRQCQAAGVACFVKQMGSNSNLVDWTERKQVDRKGGDMSEWPEDLRVREFPKNPSTEAVEDGR